jgi:pimeloyl-ACP methyl ester carboxylesterase
MGRFANAFGPHAAAATYIGHSVPEQFYNTGEVHLNYVTVGDASHPAILLIPGQTESWWGYEPALPLLAEHFHAFAVDLRGQGRSSRTPGRYTLDNMGNDLVRFIDGVIGRPTYVSGLSSGGVLAAWLSAYAKPGQILGAHYEDPPLFASEFNPSVGTSIRQGIGDMFALWSKYLGDQWSVGDWDGLIAAAPHVLPARLAGLAAALPVDEPPQNLKEYDPEWGRAFQTGTVAASCDHEAMLAAVHVPVLFTHHFRTVDETTGALLGAISDLQAARVRQVVTGAGQPFDYRSFPAMGHSMHGQDPRLFTSTLVGWVESIGAVASPRAT